jgi:putative transposase
MVHGYNRAETNVHYMHYHFIWCPKYRRAVLVGKLAARCEEIIRGKIAEFEKSEVLSLEVMPDHIHLFISTQPIYTPNRIIGEVKGVTSKKLREEFPELKSRLPSMWTRSYFVSTHKQCSSETIQKYIEEQKGK